MSFSLEMCMLAFEKDELSLLANALMLYSERKELTKTERKKVKKLFKMVFDKHEQIQALETRI